MSYELLLSVGKTEEKNNGALVETAIPCWSPVKFTQRLDCVRINWLFGLFVYCGKGKAESVGWEGRKTKWELLASALPMGLDTGVDARRNPLPQPPKIQGKPKKAKNT